MKIIAIGGEPAVGKTTLINDFFLKIDWWEEFKFKKVYGHYNKKINTIIVGKYGTNTIFAGTDKLSMSVHPDFKQFVNLNKKFNILFEGDRLFSKSILEFCDEKNILHTIILESNFTEKRHFERKDNQSQKFLKGRKTKIQNIKKLNLKKNIKIFENNNLTQKNTIYDYIFELLTKK